jgi:hypothetical protein
MEPAEDTPVTVKNTDYGTNTSQSRAEGPQGIIVNLSGEDYDIDKVEETIIDSSVIENERKKSNDSQKPSGANSSDDGIINPTYARKVLQKHNNYLLNIKILRGWWHKRVIIAREVYNKVHLLLAFFLVTVYKGRLFLKNEEKAWY